MYPYHEVLAMFEPNIEFYVVDVKRLESGRPQVFLTVLTSHVIGREMQSDIIASIQRAMTNDDCKRLAVDLGWTDPITSIVLLHVECRYLGEPLS